MITLGWSLKCHKCGQPLSVYYARHYVREVIIGAILVPNRGDSLIKAKCPTHGAFKTRFNNKLKELWMDRFSQAMLRCMKCDQIGIPSDNLSKDSWIFFQIKCPVHGLTDTKRISLPLFDIAMKLHDDEISYQEYVELYHPDKFLVCEFCGHTIEPGRKICEKCGEEVISIDLDW